MSEEKQTVNININMKELITIGGNVLASGLIRPGKDKAKQLFKRLKQGESISVGELTLEDKLKAPLKLALDKSEFKGQGFNFDLFEAGLKLMLAGIERQLKSGKEPNMLTSETGTVALMIPGITRMHDQDNVLLLAFELGIPKEVTLKLMYVDPAQFKPAEAAEE